MDTRSTGSRLAGALATVVLAGTLALGPVASPQFTWPTDPFSVVGGGDGLVALAFNAGLVFVGVCWLAATLAVREARGTSVAGALGLVAVGFVLAGAFPMPHVVHAVGGGVILFGIPLVLAIDAAGSWRAGRSREAVVIAGGLIATLAIWLPYDLGMESLQLGYAVAELVAFGALAAWTLWVLRFLPPRQRSTPTTTDGR